MKKTIFLFFVLIEFISVQAWSIESVDQKIQKLTQLNFVTGPDYKPLIDEKASDGGPLVKRLKKVLSQQKVKLSVQFMPWARAEKMTEESKSDGTFPYVFSEERNAKFLYSNAIHKSSVRLFVNKKGAIEKIEGSKSARVCRPVGYDLEKIRPLVEKYDWKLESASGLSECFKMLNSQRVDMVPISEDVGWYTISSTFDGSKDQFRTLDAVLYDVSYFVIVGKNHPHAAEIISLVNKALESEK